MAIHQRKHREVSVPVTLRLACHSIVEKERQTAIPGGYSLSMVDLRKLFGTTWRCPLWSFKICFSVEIMLQLSLYVYTAFVKIYHGRLEHPCSGSDNPGYIYSLSGTKVIRLVSPWIFWICPWQGDWDFASAFREGHKRCRWKKRHLCRKKMQTIFL